MLLATKASDRMLKCRLKGSRRGGTSQDLSLRALRRKAHRATMKLREVYGTPDLGNKRDPLDELVFIVLSQMTTGPSFSRVFDRLKEAASWETVLEARLPRLKALIRDAGLSGQKAPRIRAILRKIKRDFGEVRLDAIRGWPDDEVTRYLTSLPGVGVKSAKCVMMYSLGREVLPVDTHVWRVARRLGLVDPAVPYSRIHDTLERVVPKADRYAFHVNAVVHGRRRCFALRPRCQGCPLGRMSIYARAAHSLS